MGRAQVYTRVLPGAGSRIAFEKHAFNAWIVGRHELQFNSGSGWTTVWEGIQWASSPKSPSVVESTLPSQGTVGKWRWKVTCMNTKHGRTSCRNNRMNKLVSKFCLEGN